MLREPVQLTREQVYGMFRGDTLLIVPVEPAPVFTDGYMTAGPARLMKVFPGGVREKDFALTLATSNPVVRAGERLLIRGSPPPWSGGDWGPVVREAHVARQNGQWVWVFLTDKYEPELPE